ncbi:hypothetical protein QTN47_18420 [Danxiaibacter flavus]|uniref:DUF3300 domain-containing protein n=1 Tax=Danxiaibacter flavus TaxID=3049108 RepID=A0ABV3ZK11_9BACT|nr:hypothetical protein QNM32_18430 [Chitinophagaceae bacterium DXS]
MKKLLLPCLIVALGLISLPAFSQDKKDSKEVKDTLPMLGLAGDNLDLYAVLDLFQKSKTIEAFEKSLNDPKEKINNLDLNLDNKVDFIKVVTKKDEDSYRFILQDDISKTETQDVAVILLDRNKDKKISLQIVGDEELYGKDYVIEPKGNSPVTPNPAYKGEDPVTVAVPATTTTVVVQQAPIVQYVYSPAYVPYAPPYYYGYYPPWFGFATVMAVGIYRSNHYYHGGYYGGHYHGGNNTVIINNRNSINHYNSTRNRSATVSDNRARGSYGNGSIDGNRGGGRPSASTRPSNTPSNRPSASTRPSNTPSNRPSASTRPATSDRAGGGSSFSNRQTPSASTRQSSNFSSSRSGSGFSGGGRSMGGGARGGGGGGRRR